MSRRFAPGDTVVWRIIWHGCVWWAVPVTVVQDSELVALYTAPGTRFKAGKVLDGDPRLPTDWRLVDRVVENPVLQLTKVDEAHSFGKQMPSDAKVSA